MNKSTMRLEVPFITPIAIFDFSYFLDHMRDVFKNTEMGTVPEAGYKTTLNLHDYWLTGGSEHIEDLGKGVDSELLHQKILESSSEFLTALGVDLTIKEPVLKACWLNEMYAGTEHGFHSHTGSLLSGCFYVDVPKEGGKISFLSPLNRWDKVNVPMKNLTNFNASICEIVPQEGELFLWESYLMHGVQASNFEGSRRCLAFDIFLKNKNFEDLK